MCAFLPAVEDMPKGYWLQTSSICQINTAQWADWKQSVRRDREEKNRDEKENRTEAKGGMGDEWGKNFWAKGWGKCKGWRV